ncbi:hypothetical protein [Pontibacter lucknowensis]|uniref:Uncharacterized protein n=1 Tax=Pontibacter lucknowensis TaxID=1077936 RepID=A0A1N7BFM5_9BACT|nr:hypothetical protein [Pontibacter lucknowensis]SIR50102.1 hypothetical protein SAMN05421545_3946 [Pontibacter lucknowensis]
MNLYLYLSFLSLILSSFTLQSENKKEVAGTYGIGAFEFLSVLKLNENKEFEYRYAVGGCQAVVTGTWMEESGIVKLTSNSEFLPKDDPDPMAPTYPVFDNTKWKVKAKGLKPVEEIDTGCFKTKKLHKRIKKKE